VVQGRFDPVPGEGESGGSAQWFRVEGLNPKASCLVQGRVDLVPGEGEKPRL